MINTRNIHQENDYDQSIFGVSDLICMFLTKILEMSGTESTAHSV